MRGSWAVPVFAVFFVTLVALAGNPQTVFAAGVISEGFAKSGFEICF